MVARCLGYCLTSADSTTIWEDRCPHIVFASLRRSVWQGPPLVRQMQYFVNNKDNQDYCGGREGMLPFVIAVVACVCCCRLLAHARCIMQVLDLRRLLLQRDGVD